MWSMPMRPGALKLADGRIWHNLVIPEKRKVAETLTEFQDVDTT